MTTKFIEVLDPTAKAVAAQMEITTHIGDLNGKIIGFLDNRKPNFDVFLTRLEELLCQKFNFSDIIRVKKGDTDNNAPLATNEMDKLVARCDLVLNGICD